MNTKKATIEHHTNTILVAACAVILVVLLVGCGPNINKPVDKAIASLDRAIAALERQSTGWQGVVEETRDELVKQGQSTIANEVSQAMARAISDAGIEARCSIDFVNDRLRQDLIRIRATLTNEKPQLRPVFCNPNPNVVRFTEWTDGSVDSIEISGYDLDAADIRVLLIDRNNQSVDVSRHMAYPSRYLATLNLGGNGVPLTPSSDKLVFELSESEQKSVSIIQPVAPLLKVKVFAPEVSERANHPEVTVKVPDGWKIIGGGARAVWEKHGSLLVASYPASLQTWTAQSKDHDEQDLAVLYAYAIAIEDPDDQWEVRIFEATSAIDAHPAASVSVDPGYVMTGGGARVNWQPSEPGNLLTASYPASENTWSARSKDHKYSSPASITVYAIGIRPRSGVNFLKTRLFRSESAEGAHLEHKVQVERGYTLLGGGAEVNWTGDGNLLTASYPEDDSTWAAASKDHLMPSVATLTVWAIGLKR